MERPNFQPGRLEPCFCNSGQRFKNCCGSQVPNRKPPYGVHVIRNFLSPTECQDMVEWADRQVSEPLQVIDQSGTSRSKVAHAYSDQRITDRVKLGKRHTIVDEWMVRAVTRVIQPAFRKEVAWFEAPALMRYQPGGVFKQHADSEKLVHARNSWQKVLDRDVSILAYMNSDYEGGWLSFPIFNFRFKPQAGDLVCFPSDSRYQHEAEVLESGRRYALVSWVALKGVPRVLAGPPEGSVHFK